MALGSSPAGASRTVSPQARGRERLIFALDVGTLDAARELVRRVGGEVGMLKVGLELFVGYGRESTDLVHEHGLELFLDLKLHDIPETVSRAVRMAAQLGARYLTVHASGGRAMLREAAARAAEARAGGGKLEVVAVTVLTSLDTVDLASQGIARDPASHAVALARMAWEEGVRAFVCSPGEAAALREQLGPTAVLITPGIRPAGSAVDDQKRVSTPTGAVQAGADCIVVGRPIRDAHDPAEMARSLAAELDAALEARS